jgi:hypothetical protein
VQVLINVKGKLTSSQKAPLHKIVTQAQHASPPPELSAILDRASAAMKPQWSDTVTRQANELFALLYSCAPFSRVLFLSCYQTSLCCSSRGLLCA